MDTGHSSSSSSPRICGTVYVQRALAGDRSPEVVEWLVQGLRTWERAGGEVTIERCLHLPTAAKRRKQTRDYWALCALRLMSGSSAAARRTALVNALDRFIGGSQWPLWKAAGRTPSDASELHRCLFKTAMHMEPGRPLRIKTLERIERGARTNLSEEMSESPADTGARPAPLTAPAHTL